MEFIFPPVQKFETRKGGLIIKELLRAQTFGSTYEKCVENGIQFYIIKQSGNDVFVFFDKVSLALKKKYKYVLKQSNTPIKETVDKIDISEFTWLKHPLLEATCVKKFTQEQVYNSWKDAFHLKTDIDHGNGLRVPQVGSLYALQAHWTISAEAAIIVLPTGTGKTDTMISALVACKIKKLLVIVPTDALRDQLSFKFSSLGVLPIFNMISDECESPIVGLMKNAFHSEKDTEMFFHGANVIVATMSVLTHCPSEIQSKIAELTSHLFIDEAHHTPAETWQTFKKKFINSKIVLFTATPFRNDGKRLEGKIVFNFPLKKAQEMDYFKPIFFKPINEYVEKEADKLIADKAVTQLQEDLGNGYDHLLMVRVNSIARGEEILPLYEAYDQFKPVLIHSQIKPKSRIKDLIKDILAKKNRIVICVDMLGEGFDLPELKIAAFHDTKKSLTITLQLAGRFTRVKSNLGPATFIANIADPSVNEDLEDLYYRDSDWNILLPDLSYKMSLEQEDFRAFLEGFKGFPDKFPIQAIKHPLSTIIFKAKSDKWKPLDYKKGIKGIDNYQFQYGDYNKSHETLVVILGKKTHVKWAKVQDFESIEWDIIICYFDKKTNLLYLHASNTNSYYNSFVESICEGAKLLNGEEIFRCFYNINRLRLHNVGVREPMGRAMSYIMRVGSDIKRALRDTEIKKAIKSNIFGVGFENGNRASIGCSHHGRIWSMRTNNILTWIHWCKGIANKVTDPSIDPDIVLKGTLLPKDIPNIPDILAFGIEWPDIIFRQLIGSFEIIFSNEAYPIWNCDIELKNQTKTSIQFDVVLPSGSKEFELILYTEDKINKFKFISKVDLFLHEGNNKTNLCDLFYEYPPLIYFVDGSFLEGNLHTEITEIIPNFSMDKIELHDWNRINIRKESQTYLKHQDSIQYSLIQKLVAENKYSLLMDDDDKGEIGDIIGFHVFEDQKVLVIDVYHCKYSSEDFPGLRVKDFYEVCGQAQRSIKWMECIEEIFKHLGRRNADRLRRLGVSRFEVGDDNLLDLLKRRAKKDLKVKMNIFIVQPGLSFGDYDETSEISKLLAVVETYLKETWNADLKVIASE